jgi:hypothetical protein
MSTVALQADVGNIPSNSLAMLGSVRHLLKALSADDVHPLAVLQLETLGACFLINGDLAARIPDLLVRSSSARLGRLSHWVGWMAGDTASVMAQTSGGRAAALLSLALCELYGAGRTGELLYRLSSLLLPADQNQSSIIQLGQVAEILRNKLTVLAFGSHLARHVTRIREAYFNAGLRTPPTLLDQLTVETMIEFISALQKALQDETVILYVQGCHGLGFITAVVMAICPNDVQISVENGIIFQGPRCSVIISIKVQNRTEFGIETIVQHNSICSGLIETDGRVRFWEDLSMRIEGSLSDALDLALVPVVSLQSTDSLRQLIVELITAVVFSLSGNQLYSKPGPQAYPLPREGFKLLLGPDIFNRVRSKLSLLFKIEPSMSSFDCVSAYLAFRGFFDSVIPPTTCVCGQCFVRDSWCLDSRPGCAVSMFLEKLHDIIGSAVLLLFVVHDKDACINIDGHNVIGAQVRHSIRRALDFVNGGMQYSSGMGVKEDSNSFDTTFSALSLHEGILGICGKSFPTNFALGFSSGYASVFPSTIQEPIVNSPQCITYIIAEGRFHDHRHYYKYLTTERGSTRVSPKNSILHPHVPISPSSIGVHSTLTLTVREAYYSQLQVRTMVQAHGGIVDLNFLDLHLSLICLSFAKSCNHDTRDGLHAEGVEDILPTSVVAPAITCPESGNGEYLCLTMTHMNPEAQFLCGGFPYVPTLFQGGSCLNCVVREAKENGFKMIIQS